MKRSMVTRFSSVPGEEEIWPPMNGGGAGEDASSSTPAFAGIDEITDGARAFIKCTRQALIGGQAAGLPRDRVVLEIHATGEPDEEVVAACRGLKEAGFLIALENFQGAWQEPLADVADIIKLDVTASTDRAQWLLLRKYRPRGTIFMAEKVEKRPQFQAAVQQGYSYFQGQFYLPAAAHTRLPRLPPQNWFTCSFCGPSPGRKSMCRKLPTSSSMIWPCPTNCCVS